MEYEKMLSEYDYAELRVESSFDSLISIKNKEVKHSAGSSQGMSVRILKDGSWGFASTTGKKTFPQLLEKAEKLAALNSGNIRLKAPKAEKKVMWERIQEMETEEKIKSLLDAAGEIKAPEVASMNISYIESTTVDEFYNSLGSNIKQENAYCYLYCSTIAREGNLIQQGSERSWSKKGFRKIKANQTAKKSKEKALRLLRASPPPKGRMLTVLDPEMTGVFTHEALGHACEADAVVDKESILAGRIEQKIGNELVTIIDDPSANDFGYYQYDNEGVKGEKTTLVEKGILKTYLNSMETAEALGLNLNGHARAGSYDDVPIVRMSNTYFQPGENSVDDVFDIKEGIYLKGMKGGSVDIFSGGFMFRAEEAYKIKNGEKKEILRDVTITGNILQTMQDVECVGKDFGTSPGICGKFSQQIPVSDGGPHIRVKDVTIG